MDGKIFLGVESWSYVVGLYFFICKLMLDLIISLFFVLTLQQLQQQFLKWQQNLVQQSHGYRVLPQSPLHCAFPIESYNLSQSPPELQQHRVLQQSQFYVQEPQNPTHALDTSTSSTNQVPNITINDLVELETLSDSQLNALIHRQCQLVQFRDFVKRLDKIMEKNS